MSDVTMRLHDSVTLDGGIRVTASAFDNCTLLGIRTSRAEHVMSFANAAEVRAVAALLIRAADAMKGDAP